MFGTNKLSKKRDYPENGMELAVQTIFSTLQGEGPFSGQAAIFLRLAGCNLRCHFCDTAFEKTENLMFLETVIQEIMKLADSGKRVATKLVVITGGEPLLQNIIPLMSGLHRLGFHVQVETAGTVWVEGLETYISNGTLTLVCSPKTGEVHPKIKEHCYDWKYLIKEGEISEVDGLPNMSTQVPGRALTLFRPFERRMMFGPLDTIWLQPCEEYKVQYEDNPREVIPIVKAEDVFYRTDTDLADQRVTGSKRDETRSWRNVLLARDLAIKFNYRLSVQLHKLVGLP